MEMETGVIYLRNSENTNDNGGQIVNCLNQMIKSGIEFGKNLKVICQESPIISSTNSEMEKYCPTGIVSMTPWNDGVFVILKVKRTEGKK